MRFDAQHGGGSGFLGENLGIHPGVGSMHGGGDGHLGERSIDWEEVAITKLSLVFELNGDGQRGVEGHAGSGGQGGGSSLHGMVGGGISHVARGIVVACF